MKVQLKMIYNDCTKQHFGKTLKAFTAFRTIYSFFFCFLYNTPDEKHCAENNESRKLVTRFEPGTQVVVNWTSMEWNSSK